MFNFLKRADKILKRDYTIDYPKDSYSRTAYTIIDVDGIYDLGKENKKITIPAFSKIYVVDKEYINGVSLISYEDKKLSIPYVVYESAIVSCEDSGDIVITGPDGKVKWPIQGIASSFWRILDSEMGLYSVSLPLLGIFLCAHKKVVDSFAHGIFDVLQQYDEIKDDVDYYKKGSVQDEISKLVIGVYNTIKDMGGFMDFSEIKSVEEFYQEKQELDRIENEKYQALEKAKKERYNDFMEKLKSRQELLKQFNGQNIS